jgi:NADH-quinone oxidoreductase subunit M
VIGAVGALGLIFTVVYALRAVLKTTFGPLPERFQAVGDLYLSETFPMLVMVLLIVLIGVYPAVLSAPMQETLDLIVSRIGG